MNPASSATPPGAEQSAVGVELWSRAVVAARSSFTISDPRQPDNPLIYVNPAFERTTGYSLEEVVGRNCRFLQAADTDPTAVREIRELLERRESGVVTLLNQRKDGSTFWNELSLSPLYDGTGELTHFVGIQADVTPRVLIEQERDQHLATEQAARATAERFQRRLALLAEATAMLAATLDVQESLSRLAALVVPLMADFCTVDLIVDSDGGMRRLASRHADPELGPVLELIAERQATLEKSSLTRRVLEGGSPVLLERVAAGDLAAATQDPELQDAYRRLAISSMIVVPLRARRHVLGTLSLFTSLSGRSYDEHDLSMAADLGRRAALTVDNARLYQREHDVAEALQRSLLPALPDVAGLDRAARYLPSRTAGQVGGDWYDLLPLPDGTIGLAIGDVMGHDLTAAAAMGQLRSVLRSYAWQGGGPAEVLDRLDELVQGMGMAQLATTVYGRLHLPSETGPGMLRYSNAGHLPPALRAPDGSVSFLTGGQSLLVGAALGTRRIEAQAVLEPGSVLVLYTDGLVEDRDVDIDDGLAALAATLTAADGADAESVADALTEALTTGERSDDIAILVVKV